MELSPARDSFDDDPDDDDDEESASPAPQPPAFGSRGLLAGCISVLAVLIGFFALTLPLEPPPPAVPFVSARGQRLFRGDEQRRFMGANLWYAVHLGCRGCDRDRLDRELDALKAAGVSSVRINALSEGPDDEPWRVVPTLQPAAGEFVEDIAVGLDYTLQALEARGMDATVTLHNMWPWSGGFAQYVSWTSGEPIPYPPPAEGGDWGVFQAYASRFYDDEEAMDLADAAIEHVVGRTSSLSGEPLARSPAILAWELCNEPRGDSRFASYHAWLQRAAALVKRLDPNHLVAIGSEGTTPFDNVGVDVLRDHALAEIDVMTIHVWPQNWAWYEPLPAEASDASLSSALGKATAYVQAHVAMAAQLNKPLILEEFGLARDGEGFTPQSTDAHRRRFYGEMFAQVLASQLPSAAAEISGVSFWAWAGEGRPREPGRFWRRGDDLVGDPPHERQGWYSVFDEDHEMTELLAATAARINGNASSPFYARPQDARLPWVYAPV